MIVVDTGPLYAAVDTSDSRHRACVAVFEETSEQLVVPVSVVIETCFLIERHLGSLAEAAFIRSLGPSGLIVESLNEPDLDRMAHSSRPMPICLSARLMLQ